MVTETHAHQQVVTPQPADHHPHQVNHNGPCPAWHYQLLLGSIFLSLSLSNPPRLVLLFVGGEQSTAYFRLQLFLIVYFEKDRQASFTTT